MLSAEGVTRGEVPEKTYDIHCPMFGGDPKFPNYLASSCAARIDNGSCFVKDCLKRGGEVVTITHEEQVAGPKAFFTEAQDRPVVVCKCGCGRSGKHAAKGYIASCYDRWYRLNKRGLGHTFGPPKFTRTDTPKDWYAKKSQKAHPGQEQA